MKGLQNECTRICIPNECDVLLYLFTSLALFYRKPCQVRLFDKVCVQVSTQNRVSIQMELAFVGAKRARKYVASGWEEVLVL